MSNIMKHTHSVINMSLNSSVLDGKINYLIEINKSK